MHHVQNHQIGTADLQRLAEVHGEELTILSVPPCNQLHPGALSCCPICTMLTSVHTLHKIDVVGHDSSS
eukprot:1160011-Pelagomonas_calceolata.AAC.6